MTDTKSQSKLKADIIPRIKSISPDEFKSTYIDGNKPIVITDMMENWPAMKKWSFSYFLGLNTDLDIYLEEGNVIQNPTIFHRDKFKDFITKLLHKEDNSSIIDTHNSDSNSNGTNVSYLSVFDIFKSFPELRSDVDFSLLSQFKIKNIQYAWMGPTATVTGFHIDWADNILAQIYGKKKIRLISPMYTRSMYPSHKYEFGSRFSSVDADHIDLVKFPKFAQTQESVTELSPGEMLFIPYGWWHYVKSLSNSISVNNFGISLKNYLYDGTIEGIKYLLHKCNLYGRECTCHAWKDGIRIRK